MKWRFRGLKMQTFENGVKVQVFENDTIIASE